MLLVAIRVLSIAGSLAAFELVALVFHLALGLTAIGGLFEGEAWGRVVEWARLASLLVAAMALAAASGAYRGAALAALAWLALSMVWLALGTRGVPPVPAHSH